MYLRESMQTGKVQVFVDSKPHGHLDASHLGIDVPEVPVASEGAVVPKTIYMSIDLSLLRVIKGIETYIPILPGDAMFGPSTPIVETA